MRRVWIAMAVTAAALAALPAAAQASFHLQMVNEVMLASATGDSSVRFVELYDAGGAEETFPAFEGPYGLAIYDAAGHPIPGDKQTLNGGPPSMPHTMAAAALANRPYLVSTPKADTAFGTTRDQTLTLTLPKAAGQACYTAFGGTPYSCITWGCISHFVSAAGTGSFHGAVPPNGMSGQRQNDNSVQIGAPTPGAANKPGAATKPCPNSGGSQFPGVQIPKQTDTVKKGKAPVVVKCPAKAKGSCTGKLTLKTAKAVTDSNGKKRIVTLGSASFTIGARKSKTVKVGLSKQGKFVVAHHKSIGAVATAKAHDGSTSKNKTTTRKITLQQPPKK